jgi:HNH endonuclease
MSYAKGLCSLHYNRQRLSGTPGPAGLVRKHGFEYLDDHGYVVTKDGRRKNGRGLKHRLVMEQILNRPLEPFENVHHKNGVRHDNRPENLELWTKPQPSGQRPEDLVAWVVHYYPDLVDAELKTHKRDQRTGQLRLIV